MSNLVVQTNVLALNSHRNLKTIGVLQEKSSQKLSSGYKVNSAADDAAGLAISEKMRSQIRGLDMASKNAQDAISLIQTAEGGMQEIDNMVQRIRELVVYAANDTQDPNNGGTNPPSGSGLSQVSSGDRQKIQDEISSLMKEIDSMAGRVEFNKKKLINGDFASGQPLRNEGMKLQDAAAAAATAFTVASALSAASSGAASAASGALTDAVSDVADAIGDAFTAAATALATPSALSGAVADLVSDAEASVDALAATLGTATSTGAAADIKAGIDKLLADLKTNAKGLATAAGATSAEMTTLDSVLANIADGITIEWDKAATVYGVKLAADAKADAASGAAVTASDAAIFASDAFVAFSGLHSDWATAKTGDAGSIYFQVGPNANQGWTLNIGKITCQGIGLATGAITEDGIAVDAATQGNIDPNSKINVLKMTGEDDLTGLLDTIDAGLTVVTTERSKLGAAQNRLEYTMKSLDITSENLSSAESRIRDTDMAKEMMKLTKANILQQAGISMLAQANQSPQSVLQLLQ